MAGFRFSTTFNPSWKKLNREYFKMMPYFNHGASSELAAFLQFWWKCEKLTCTGRENIWWGSVPSQPLSWFWCHLLWWDTEIKILKKQPWVSWNKKNCNSWLKGEPHPSPHTSGAERLASLFPSPQQSHLHWSLSWSSRAAWHAPASLSQSYYCTGQEVYHYTTCVSLSQLKFRFYYNVNDFFLCTKACNNIWFVQ